MQVSGGRFNFPTMNDPRFFPAHSGRALLAVILLGSLPVLPAGIHLHQAQSDSCSAPENHAGGNCFLCDHFSLALADLIPPTPVAPVACSELTVLDSPADPTGGLLIRCDARSPPRG